MIFAVEAGHLHVDHREAESAAHGHRLDDTLLHRWYVLLGNGPSHHRIDEVEPLAALERGDADGRHPELTVAAGLLLVLALGLRLLGDGFPVGDADVLGQNLNAEFAL